MRRKQTIWSAIALLAVAVAAPVWATIPPEAKLDLLGTAQRPDGSYVAVLQNNGVVIVEEGDAIMIAKEGYSCRVKILSIGADKVRARVMEIIIKQKDVKVEVQDKKPVRPELPTELKGLYDLRDPFFPISRSTEQQ